jgi:hypothetical protein
MSPNHRLISSNCGSIPLNPSIKCAIIKNLIGSSRSPGYHGQKFHFQLISVIEIVAKARARYGNMQKDTKTAIMMRINIMLKTVDGLDTHISNLEKTFDISDIAVPWMKIAEWSVFESLSLDTRFF